MCVTVMLATMERTVKSTLMTVCQIPVVQEASVWMKWIALSVYATQVLLESYARLTLMTVWELTVVAMENVLMK